mmetsp:Transcript_46469/g.85138  ORF Transcript_46469/g.85138 Transcript_46469/m.85138 type:complete len:210 (+) Transcript_46469:26-655(+)
MAAENSSAAFWIGALILGAGVAVLVGWNALAWYKFTEAALVFHGLRDGKCELTSTHYTSGFKTGYSSFGTQWTEVPCWTQVEVYSDDGEEVFHGKARLSFEYKQGVIWDYVHDSCSDLLPPRQEEHRFDCCFKLSHDGSLANAWVFDGVAAKLPPLRRALFVHAAGLSIMTLSPVLVLLWCSCRSRRSEGREQKLAGQAECYEPLPDGI